MDRSKVGVSLMNKSAVFVFDKHTIKFHKESLIYIFDSDFVWRMQLMIIKG